jgi:histidinol-phosphate phosphatase family protein
MTHGTPPRLRGILFDRDGTLVVDVPFNAEPSRVAALPTAAQAVRRAREAGLRTGVATNQPGIATGELRPADLARVNARIDAVVGPFDDWFVCPHAKGAGCACRKPGPGLIEQAARRFGVLPSELALIGDTQADLGAAAAAGATGVLVPNERTLPDEVERAALCAGTLLEAVELLLGGGPGTDPAARDADAAFAGVRR